MLQHIPKTVKYILLPILVLAAGALVYLKTRKSKDFEPLIKDKLQEVVTKATNGLYKLHYDSLTIDVLASKVTLSNAVLQPDSARLLQLDSLQQAPDDVFKISLKTLDITGLGPADMLNKKNISLTDLFLDNPDIEIYHQKRAYNYQSPDTATLYRKLAGMVQSFELQRLLLRHISLTYHNLEKKSTTSFKDLGAILENIKIDSSTQFDTTRFFFAKRADIQLNGYEAKTGDNLHRFHVDSITVLATSKQMRLVGLTLKPAGDKEAFWRKLKYRKDRYDITIRNILLEDVDWYSIITGQSIKAGKIALEDANVEVYCNKAIQPSTDKIPAFPSQTLQQCPLPLMVKKIQLTNFAIFYKEYNTESKQTGTVEFAKTSGTVTNVTNIQEEIAKNKKMEIDAHTRLMNDGKLDVQFSFDLTKMQSGAFSIDAALGPMDGASMNRAIVALSMVEVEKANVQSFRLHMNGNTTGASGTVAMAYTDLSVKALKPDKNEPGELKKRGLATFMANNFVLQKDNPSKGETLKTYTSAWQHDKHRSFFSLVWKTIMQGIISSVKGKQTEMKRKYS